MAATDIYLNLEQLKSEVIAFNEKKLSDIDRAIKSANNTVRRLTLYGWEGKSKDVFVESFAKYNNDSVAFNECMKDFNKQLKTVYSNGKKLQSQSNSISAKL